MQVYTIGHSTRSLDELVRLLRAFQVAVLVDVRRIPRSGHNPQFHAEALRRSLRARKLRYVHIAELGGLRKSHVDSPNQGWRNASFRGFADYMLTDAFEAGLAKLHALSEQGTVALMCAEAVPWRCHRTLIADALTLRGAQVAEISSATRATPHHLTAFARPTGTRIFYPAEDGAGELLVTEAPFHLEATVRVLQRRPVQRVDRWEQGCYLRVLGHGGELALIELQNRATIDAPELRFKIRAGEVSASARREFARTLRKVLGLDLNPAPLLARAQAEPALHSTALALRGMRPPRFPDLFETFANVVPFQQVSLDAGVAIVNRLVERLGSQLQHAGRSFYAFPTAEVVAGARLDTLRKVGLSAQKARVLRDLARSVAAGQLSASELASMPTSDALRRLIDLPGIGPWSASLVLLRGLGRLDVFPPGDVGATRGLCTLLGLDSTASLQQVIERFGEQRGYLYFCALGASLLDKGLVQPWPQRV